MSYIELKSLEYRYRIVSSKPTVCTPDPHSIEYQGPDLDLDVQIEFLFKLNRFKKIVNALLQCFIFEMVKNDAIVKLFYVFFAGTLHCESQYLET
jgi:hypothetical protein